jgi:hypothetical protein
MVRESVASIVAILPGRSRSRPKACTRRLDSGGNGADRPADARHDSYAMGALALWTGPL